MLTKPWLLGERGAGSILALTISGAILSVGLVSIFVAQNIGGAARLQTQTESAALVTQLSVQGAIAGLACENAKRVFTLNMVFLDKCLIVGDEVVVQTRWQPFGIALRATATAVPRLAK